MQWRGDLFLDLSAALNLVDPGMSRRRKEAVVCMTSVTGAPFAAMLAVNQKNESSRITLGRIEVVSSGWYGRSAHCART